MRRVADAALIRRFLAELGRRVPRPARLYLVGGATAVLHGWRDATIDIDFALTGDEAAVLREVPRLKDELAVNVELAAPPQFVPIPAGWEDRSPSVARYGVLEVFHFDYLSQALAKCERGHGRDLDDVAAMLDRGLVHPQGLLDALTTVEPEAFRYPAIDPPTWRRAVEEAVAAAGRRRAAG